MEPNLSLFHSFNSSKWWAVAHYKIWGTGFKFYGIYGTQSWNLSHKRSKPAPGPKTSDKITRSSRMEFGVLSLQEVHKIMWNYSFSFIWLPNWCEPIVVFSTLCVLLSRCLWHPDIRHTHCPQKHIWPWLTLQWKKTQNFPAIRKAF